MLIRTTAYMDALPLFVTSSAALVYYASYGVDAVGIPSQNVEIDFPYLENSSSQYVMSSDFQAAYPNALAVMGFTV